MKPLALSEMDATLAGVLTPTVQRLGYLGDMLGIGAHQPNILLPMLSLAAAIRASLPPTSLEVIVLTVATVTSNEYEQSQHEHLCADRGYPDRWIAECIASTRGPVGSPDPLTETERIIRNLAYAGASSTGRNAADALAAAEHTLGTAGVVAAVQAIGYYHGVCTVTNTFAVASPVPHRVAPADEANLVSSRPTPVRRPAPKQVG